MGTSGEKPPNTISLASSAPVHAKLARDRADTIIAKDSATAKRVAARE